MIKDLERGQFIFVIYNGKIKGAKVKTATTSTAFVKFISEPKDEHSIEKKDCFFSDIEAKIEINKRA